MKRSILSTRPAFTLVELLVVLAIIGILAGILVPTINGVINNTRRGALKIEVDELAKAIERYRDKHGDYPPDGSDWEVFQRHLKKAFPQILNSELELLDPTGGNAIADAKPAQRNAVFGNAGIRNYSDIDSAGIVMDPAEALVFFLGGFSSDPKRPFTGRGGPFSLVTGTTNKYQYNITRENAFFEFNTARLTLAQSTAATISSDELEFFTVNGNTACLPTGIQADLLPVYMSNYANEQQRSPYVYFDSRTYVSNKNGPRFNYYQRFPKAARDADDFQKMGACYPMYSATRNTSGKGVPGLPAGTTGDSAVFLNFQFMEPTKFQVIGPGLDGRYGGRLVQEVRSASNPTTALADSMFVFPGGESLNGAFKSFNVSPVFGQTINDLPGQFWGRMNDNVANFSGTTFEAGNP